MAGKMRCEKGGEEDGKNGREGEGEQEEEEEREGGLKSGQTLISSLLPRQSLESDSYSM